MTNIQSQISILNSPAASSGDLVNSGGVISVTGLSPFPTAGLRRLRVFKNTQVQPMIWTITATAVVDDEVQIRFQEGNKNLLYSYVFLSTTASALTTDLTAWLASNGFAGTLTSNAASPTVILTYTCATTEPMCSIGAVENVTIASAMGTISPHGTAATAIAGTTTVTVTTLAAQTFRSGDIVRIEGVATMTLTQFGVSGLSAVTARIEYATATTFTLDGVTGTGTNSGTITITKVAASDLGSPTFVDNIAAANGSTATATATTYMYDMVEISGSYPNNMLTAATGDLFSAIVFIKKNVITPASVPDTNGAALVASFVALETGQ